MEKIKKMVASVLPEVVNLVVEEDKHSPQGAVIYSPNGVLVEAQVVELAKIAKDCNTSWALYPSPKKGVVFFMIDYKREQ